MGEENVKLYYVLRYALTDGVRAQELERLDSGRFRADASWQFASFAAREVSTSEEDARRIFEEMKAKRLRDLQRAITNVQGLTFEGQLAKGQRHLSKHNA